MESKGGTNIALKTNFAKKLTIISVAIIYVATEIMAALTQNLPK